MSIHAPSRTLLETSIARSSMATPLRVAVVLAGVVVTAIAAQFTTVVPFTAVPFTFTHIVAVLTGAVLGARLGATTQVLYVLAGMMGFAVFSPSITLPPGALRLVGPTGGYLLAYPLAAFVTGWLSERGWDRRYWTSFASLFAGVAIVHVGGVAWLTIAFMPSLGSALAAGLMPFAFLDLLKIAAAAMILPKIWRLVGPRG